MIAGGRQINQRAPMGAKEEHQDDACRARERLATPGERGSGRRHPRKQEDAQDHKTACVRRHASEGMRPKASQHRIPGAGGCEGARRMRRIHRGDAPAMLKARSDFDMGDVTQQAEGSVA